MPAVERPTRRSLYEAGARLLVCALLAGCSSNAAVESTPTPGSRLDADFVGFWQNSVPRFSTNWWVLTESRAANYGRDPNTGACIRGDAEIVSSDAIRVRFGNGSGEPVRIDLNVGGVNGQAPGPDDLGRLAFIQPDGSASLHHRIRRRDICLVNGVHLPDAPYPD